MASIWADAFDFTGSRLRDLVRFPFRQFVIETELSEVAVVDRLRPIIAPRSPFFARFGFFMRTDKSFAGSVSPDGFKIARIIHYGNSFLPIVVGRFEPGPTGVRVQVTMRLMQCLTIFLMLYFAILVVVIVAAVGLEIFSSQTRGIGGMFAIVGIALGMGAFAYLMMGAAFSIEARRARRLLERALQTVRS
jgi:hypothetical protein